MIFNLKYYETYPKDEDNYLNNYLKTMKLNNLHGLAAVFFSPVGSMVA